MWARKHKGIEMNYVAFGTGMLPVGEVEKLQAEGLTVEELRLLSGTRPYRPLQQFYDGLGRSADQSRDD